MEYVCTMLSFVCGLIMQLQHVHVHIDKRKSLASASAGKLTPATLCMGLSGVTLERHRVDREDV